MDKASIIIIILLVGLLGVSFGYILQPLLNHNNSTVNQTNTPINSTNNSTQTQTNNTQTSSTNKAQNPDESNIRNPNNIICPNCGSKNVVEVPASGTHTSYLECLNCGWRKYW
ncbi:MAG: hypothetical protein LLF83_00805 [Methanobacterium sp.]|nr:hypothetical protein [Methanobacterium sp.]